jgi:hypothetical protein
MFSTQKVRYEPLKMGEMTISVDKFGLYLDSIFEDYGRRKRLLTLDKRRLVKVIRGARQKCKTPLMPSWRNGRKR